MPTRQNQVQIRLTDSELEALDEISKRRLLSRSSLMRIALHELANNDLFYRRRHPIPLSGDPEPESH